MAADPPPDPTLDDLLRRLSKRTPVESRYRLEGEVARGGMGSIIKVWDADLRRHLAMKVVLGNGEPVRTGATPTVDTKQLARFLEEAQVTGQLDHPGIVPVHELGLDSDGRVYFTMKLVKGRDLKTIFDLVFAGEEGWNETRALGVILKACEAMAYAHSKGVIHRDLKPANVMVGSFGEVYVMDWGLSRVIGSKDTHDIRIKPEFPSSIKSVKTERRYAREETADSPIVTMDGDVIGTPAYMSPEQARGQIEKLSARSDVYAIGALLYHLLARHAPYVAPDARVSAHTVLGMVLQGPPAGLSSLREDVPAELVAIVEKAMARESSERYADTLSLADDLRAILEHRVVSAYETGTWAEAKKWLLRNKAMSASLVAAFSMLIAGVAFSTKYAAVAHAEARRADEGEREARIRGVIQDLQLFESLDDTPDYARAQLRPATEWWIESAQALLDGHQADLARGTRWSPGLADVESQLARLREKAIATNEPEEQLRFERSEDAWWFAQLTKLVTDLRLLEKRLAIAVRSVRSSDATMQWNEAIAAISLSPRYAGLRITPQLGLVPIGPDPESGLWEFAHLMTGEPAIRGPDGRLVLKPEMGLVFVLLPGGRVPVEDGHTPTPLNEVELDPYFISKYEMTCAQWSRVSTWSGEFRESRDPMMPANNVCWDDCVATLDRAGAWCGLPTEAQWEYACRAGTKTPWWTGADEAALSDAAVLGRTPHDAASHRAMPVGRLRANAFGLHDVHGNVYEFCRDVWASDMIPCRDRDGERMAKKRTTLRVMRGGASYSAARAAKSGERMFQPSPQSNGGSGLRPARAITP